MSYDLTLFFPLTHTNAHILTDTLDFYDGRRTLGIKKKNICHFHAVCCFGTTMLTLSSILKLLTVLNFGCVSGAIITMETAVSKLAAGTSGEIHTHTHTQEMRKDSQQHQPKTGEHRDSYKLIYKNHVNANELTSDKLSTSDKVGSQSRSRANQGLSINMMLFSDLWADTKFSDENPDSILLRDVNTGELGTELNSIKYGADDHSNLKMDSDGDSMKDLSLYSAQTGTTSSAMDNDISNTLPGKKIHADVAGSINYLESNSVESSDVNHVAINRMGYAGSLEDDSVKSANQAAGESVSSEHAGCNSVEPCDHNGADGVDSASHARGNSTESFDHDKDHSVESSEHVQGDSVDFASHARRNSIESSDHDDNGSVESFDHGGGDSVDSTDHAGRDSAESADEPEGPVVRVHGGLLRGLTLDKAHAFYGIPYAAPPVGERRWVPPQPVSPWLQTYNATFPRPACMQACAGEFAQTCPRKVCLLTANQRAEHSNNAPITVRIHCHSSPLSVNKTAAPQ